MEDISILHIFTERAVKSAPCVRTQVLRMSPESACAMQVPVLVTKSPPLLQRHEFMSCDVSPWQVL